MKQLKQTMLNRSLRGSSKSLHYLIDNGRGNLLNYYHALINKYVPHEVSITWVENFMFISPTNDFAKFTTYHQQFLEWTVNARTELAQNTGTSNLDWDLKSLLDTVSRINAEAMFQNAGLQTEYGNRLKQLNDKMQRHEPIGLKIKDEVPHNN